MKKITTILLITALMSLTSAFAQGGTTGPLTWNINNHILTISGEGDMPDYGSAPWKAYLNNLTDIVITEGVTSIGTLAFHPSSCSLNTCSVSIPSTVTHIGKEAFRDLCVLKSITIPDGVKSIELWAFWRCEYLTTVNIANSVTDIGKSTFKWCHNLQTVNLSTNLTSIETGMFEGCYKLNSIILPSSITNIGSSAFCWCESLTSITNLNLVPVDIDYPNEPDYHQVFYAVNQSTCTLTVPNSSISAYQNAAIWQNFNIEGGGMLVYPQSNNLEYGYVSGNALYPSGETATVTATPRNGYKFVKWTKDGVEVSHSNPYSFTVTEDIELVAHFKEDIVETYLVSVSVNHEEYGTATGGGVYEENTTAIVTATAYNGYKFVNWTNNNAEVSTDNPYSFTVTEDVELVANFEEEVGIKDFTDSEDIVLHPNPTGGEFKVQSLKFKVQSIEVFDMYGRNLLSHTANRTPHAVIDISHLHSGIYFVRITTEHGVVMRKVVKY